MSSLTFHSKNRFKLFRNTIKEISELDFPYHDAKFAVELIKKKSDDIAIILNEIEDMEEGVVKLQCSDSLLLIVRYLRLLGFILNSTNTRNSFEIVRPLRCLARKLLEPEKNDSEAKIRLIISSEWEYSPHVFFDFIELPNFVMIGLPAHESSNPLLIPLSGHELGHPLWKKKNLSNHFKPIIENLAFSMIEERWEKLKNIFPYAKSPEEIKQDMFAMQTIERIISYSLGQVEEIFSDSVGIRIFGASFLRAFHYLLSPGIAESRRNPLYPKLSERVKVMNNIASQIGVPEIPTLEQSFSSKNIFSEVEGSYISIIDDISIKLIDDIVKKTKECFHDSDISLVKEDSDTVLSIYNAFNNVIPYDMQCTLQEVLCAAWKAYEDIHLWENEPVLCEHRDRILNDLILKTFEILDTKYI